MRRNLIILALVSILWGLAPSNRQTLPTEYDSGATFTGYPAPYSSDAPVTSMAFDDYVLPLAINFACYSAVALVLLWLWRTMPILQGRWLNAGLALVIWMVGAVPFFMFMVLVVSGDVDLHLWYDDVTWAALKERYF